MENMGNIAQIKQPDLNFNEHKRKCLTHSEYNTMVSKIDSWINDPDFVLNKYGKLITKALSEFSHLYDYTVLSIVDSRIQYYVRQRHHRVFNSSNNNSPAHNSKSNPVSTTTSPSHQQPNNKRLFNPTNTLYNRYKELVAGGNLTSPLITLADNIRMPAMLVAKNVLDDYVNEEKSKDQMEINFRKHNLHNDNSTTSTSTQDISVPNSLDTELDTLDNVDVQLSQSLKWLSNKLLSMRKVLPTADVLDESNNSSINSNPYCDLKITKYATVHQLATSTWLIRADPQLAYQVYKCSVIDCYYGSCVEFIKSCTGQRYEQLLEKNVNLMTMGAKANGIDGTPYTTEKECRIRGLDMTPDMVLHEPIAISLSDNDDGMKDSNEFTATNYVGKNDKEIRVLNWIESKAMFGGPDQLRTFMPRQLFPYWNRYGPGAVIFWFGHIIEDGEEDQIVHRGVSIDKTTFETGAIGNVRTKTNSTESSAFSFWSKYCLLMDGFPEWSRILQHTYKNSNKFNLTKKKNSTTL